MVNAWRDLIAYFRKEPWVAVMLAVMIAATAFITAFSAAGAHSEASRLKTTHQIEEWGARLTADPAHQQLMVAAAFLILLIVILGIVWDLRLLARSRRSGALPIERFNSPRTPWGLGEAFKALVLLFFLDLVFSVILSAGLAIAGIHASNGALMGASFVRSVVIAFYLIVLVRRRYGGSWSDLGLCHVRWVGQALCGLGGYLAMIPVYFLTLAVLMGILRLFDLETPVQTPIQVLYTEGSTRSMIAFGVFMGVLGPWFEEFFFRGFVYPAFRNRMGATRGILTASVLFAALHGHGIAFAPILVLGLALNFLYERTGSIVPGAVLHMTHNSAMLLITLGIKQGVS